MFENIHLFVISFLIGLLIGVERERSAPEGTQAIGVRTFILFALLGTLAAIINVLALTVVLSIFIFAAILLGYLRSTAKDVKHKDIGLTTEISAAVVFYLGYFVPRSPVLTALIASIVLLVLLERKRLHLFSRKALKPQEIEAAVALLIFVLGILPFLLNHTIDPWQLFNPRFFGVLIAVIAAVQFSGYVAVRIFGQHLGMAFMGFFGGLVSSTAVFVVLPKTFRDHPKLLRSIVAAAIFSVVGTLIELVLVLLIASTQLLLVIIWPLVGMILVGGGLASLLTLRQNHITKPIQLKNPLDWFSILRLALFIGSILIVVAIAKRYIGIEAVKVIAFLSGLFELQGITLTTASFYVNSKLQLLEAANILAIAVLASFVSKFFLLWSLARNRFAIWTSCLLLVVLMVGVSLFWLNGRISCEVRHSP